tara:strand:+ start:2502 stop:3404 length:903 start_codon:yes stop_codon:yes gene_type:complete
LKKQLTYWYRKYTPKFLQNLIQRNTPKKPKFWRYATHEKTSSNFDALNEGHLEHLEIISLLEGKNIQDKYYVDLGASDGVYSSSTFLFAKDNKWSGLSVEMDNDKFALMSYVYSEFENISLTKNKITPNNIQAILDSFEVPKDFTVLNLDIDSYDLFVIKELLMSGYRPQIISMEINEKIPPPIYFTVLFDPSHYWKGDHFFGCSLTAACSVVKKFDYKLVKLQYNNAIFVRSDFSQDLNDASAKDAYLEGYANKVDREKRFSYNKDVDILLDLSPDEMKKFIENFFKKYDGLYSLSVDE